MALQTGTAAEVFRVFLRLGLTSFGGPVAHLGYFPHRVRRAPPLARRAHYADIVALCQFLPGPASSQVGISIGILRAGLPGALAAWLGFTLPSALAMILFGYGVSAVRRPAGAAWLHGLKIVAVAVVAQAVWGMAQNLSPDRERPTIAVGAAFLALAVPSALGPGRRDRRRRADRLVLPGRPRAPLPPRRSPVHRPRAGRSPRDPVLRAAVRPAAGRVLDPAARARAVRRLLSLGLAGVRRRPCRAAAAAGGGRAAGLGRQRRLPRGLWRGAGGAGAAVHLRGLSRHGDEPPPNGWIGGLLCLAGIFLPSFLLLSAPLPFWECCASVRRCRRR